MSRMKYPVFIGLALSLMMTLAGFQTRALAHHHDDDDDCCCPMPIVSQPVCCPAPAPVISCPAPAISGPFPTAGFCCPDGYQNHRRLYRRGFSRWGWWDD